MKQLQIISLTVKLKDSIIVSMPVKIPSPNINPPQQLPTVNPNPPVVIPTPPSVPAVTTPNPVPTIPSVSVNNTVVVPIEESKNTGGIIKKFFLTIFLLLLLGGGSTGGYYFYTQVLNNPSKLLSESFTKLGNADSFSTGLTFADIPDTGRISMSFDYQKDTNKYGRAEIKFDKIAKSPNDYFTFSAIYRENEIYLMPFFTKMVELENEIAVSSPQITAMATYQLLLPVLNGQKWLMIKVPKGTFSDTGTTSSTSGKNEITKEQEKELRKKFLNSISMRSFNKNFSYNDKKYSRITFGLKKKETLELVEYLKTLKLETKLSDINNLKQVIESVDAASWNSELIEILIDNTTKVPYLISFSLPEISKDVLEKSISQAESDSKSSLTSILDSKVISESLSTFFNQNKRGKLIYLGKITFADYNSVPTVTAPMDVVDFDIVATAAQQELMPLIGQMLMRGSNQNPYLPQSPYPTQ